MASKPDDKKTMDVAKPGKSAPDTSARPVLVTHRPMVQDPMVKDDPKADSSSEALAKGEDQTADDTKSKPEPTTHGEKVISPVSDPTVAEATEEPKPEPAEVPEPVETAKPEKSAEETRAEEAAVVDAVADQATSDKRKQNELTDEEKAKQEAIQKLITEKKYFVPVGQVSHRRNQRLAIVFLVLVILLAGAYIAIDAGVIDIGVKLPLELIKN